MDLDARRWAVNYNFQIKSVHFEASKDLSSGLGGEGVFI